VKVYAFEDWREKAACLGYPKATSLMFSFSRSGIEVAQMLCSTCPSRLPCLRYAIRNSEDHGVWGGVSANDRYELRMGRMKKVKMYVKGEWVMADPLKGE
jgi:WhiB family redox-sensing transcriptional regulator